MSRLAVGVALLLFVVSCGGGEAPPAGNTPASGAPAPGAPASTAAAPAPGAPQLSPAQFVEGQDYIVLDRHVFLDNQRFDRPVEGFSLLFPRGWKVDGGVKWLGIGNCRADIVSNVVNATSPDGAFKYQVMPSRSFQFTADPMMRQVYLAGAQAGGCAFNAPFDARQYVQGYAQRDLQATASDIRINESRIATARQLDEQVNASARQFGNQMQQTTTFASATITWPDGDEGFLDVGVMNILTPTHSTTSVFYCVLMRYPAARRDEGLKLYYTIYSSFRQNPIWKQAKENFLTQLGNIEHKGRLDTIQLMGEQARAYAQSASAAQDRQMRDWEKQQSSQDAQHKGFIQTIREVETWRDANGPVELSSGYSQAWSRGDGSYLLSNKPTFDPSSVFQDQRWTEMKREKPGGLP